MEGATEMNVTGLTPFFSYTFSVTAENSVSSQDTDNAARTTSVSATTLEGGMLLYSENACGFLGQHGGSMYTEAYRESFAYNFLFSFSELLPLFMLLPN